MANIRIVFMGSDGIALPMLNWIANEGREIAEIVGVFTQPDRATGRGQKVVPNAIKQWATEKGLAIHQPEKLDAEAKAALGGLAPDLCMVMAYGHILRDDVIALPRLGTVNLHASLLPAYRGASPIQTAVAEGEPETGVTLMRIVRKLDAGPMADREAIRIEKTDTADLVEAKMASACVPLIARTLPALADGSLVFSPQDDAAATFCRKLVKDDGHLDWTVPAARVASRVNGLYPWPGCTIPLNGQLVKLGLAEAVERVCEQEAGTVLEAGREGILVAAGLGAVRLHRLQRPGGRMLTAAEFLNGFTVAPGTFIPSAPASPLVGREPFRLPKPGTA